MKKISACEVIQTTLKQYAEVNAEINAISMLVPENQFLAHAFAADESLSAIPAVGQPVFHNIKPHTTKHNF